VPCECVSIERVFDLVFPVIEGSLAVVYDAFIDDSKDRHAEKVVVSGIFVGDKQRWGHLRTKWNRRLADEGMKYFKSAEYYGLRGEFRKFQSEEKYPKPSGREAAKQVFDDLEAIIKQSNLMSIGVVIPIQDYTEVMAMPEANGKIPTDPYSLALNSGFFETIKAINLNAGMHMVAFIHDDDEKFVQYRSLYQEFRKKNPKTAKQMGGFIPLDDKQHPPLQAADLAANVTCNFAKEWLEKGRTETDLKRLKETMFMIGVWDKNYILNVLHAQGKGKRKSKP
jgi:hypothetical protein